MGILKDASESLLKYGEVIFSKTEEYTRVAKLNIEIKKFQSDIRLAEKNLGHYVIDKIENGEKNIASSDPEVKQIIVKIQDLQKKIKSRKIKIEKIKKEASNKAAEKGKTKNKKTVKKTPETETVAMETRESDSVENTDEKTIDNDTESIDENDESNSDIS